MTATPYLPVLHGAAADRPDEADTIVTAKAVAASLRRLGYRSEVVKLGLDLGAIGRHASLGLDAASVVPAAKAAQEIVARQQRFGGKFFAEAYVEGREFNLSLLETAEGPRVLPAAEILFVDFPADRPRIVDYEAKWATDSLAYVNTPRCFDLAASDAPMIAELHDLALAAWRLFGLGGYARVDFRIDGAGRPTILEINVNPCLAPDAGFVAAAERAGLGYDAVVGSIVAAAVKGHRQQAA